MEFALTDDQKALQESLRTFLAASAPLDKVRLAADGDANVRSEIAAGLAELGVTMTLVPEAHGGLGLGLLDAALVQEMLGHFATPAPFTAGAAMAVTALVHGGSAAQQAEWLPQIASGDVRFAVAISERSGARDGAGLRAAGGKLSGKCLFALEADGATHVLAADSDGRLHIAAVDGAGIEIVLLPTIDRTRDVAEIRFAGTPAIGLDGDTAAIDRVLLAGRVLLAADTLGAAQRMLDESVAYAKERKQFNRAIGSFQAVKHMCAEMAAEIEPARALVWHAAWALDTDPAEGPLLANLARAHLAEIGTFVARTATEVHGGMGFTDLLGLHYWFKRIGLNRQLLGGPERVREDAARQQGWIQA